MPYYAIVFVWLATAAGSFAFYHMLYGCSQEVHWTQANITSRLPKSFVFSIVVLLLLKSHSQFLRVNVLSVNSHDTHFLLFVAHLQLEFRLQRSHKAYFIFVWLLLLWSWWHARYSPQNVVVESSHWDSRMYDISNSIKEISFAVPTHSLRCFLFFFFFSMLFFVLCDRGSHVWTRLNRWTLT